MDRAYKKYIDSLGLKVIRDDDGEIHVLDKQTVEYLIKKKRAGKKTKEAPAETLKSKKPAK